jgi:uncharacterized protein (TIGR03067 family)
MFTWVIASSLALGAPAAKDAPKKELPTIVGHWASEKVTVGGKDQDVPPNSIKFEFADDGTVVVRMGTDKPQSPTYKVTPKAVPPEIDLTPAAGVKRPPSLGIYKLDGDTLTICFDQEPGAARPKSFESREGSAVLVLTLKRVKKE